jgi:allantoinase
MALDGKAALVQTLDPTLCHDDQPVAMRTRSGRVLWSVPYPQELNDIPMIMARQMDAKDFAQMIIDQFDEMLDQSLRHIDAVLRRGGVWLTTPGAICRHVTTLADRGA